MKKYTRVMFHDTEECPKFEFGSANSVRNLVNFNVSSGKSESLHFDVLLFSIAYKVSSFITLKEDPKFEEKLTFLFEK